VRRHFHGVRLLKTHALAADFRLLPAVAFLNHASWWDPLICLLLADEYFPNRTSFAPIDEAALQKYRFLEKLGFFGIDVSSPRGAATFLRTATSILELPERMLWITPQGKFTDARTRPVTFRSGLAALAGRVAPTVFLPLAVEYTFWEERLPEVLVAFGTPLFTQQHQNSCGASDWNAALERGLQDAQDALAEAAQRRDPNEWELLFRGASGTTAVYDLWRQARAAIRRESFNREHSAL
jgi:1-acyl-sn-glycerol-3-phosphate acyltransferase